MKRLTPATLTLIMFGVVGLLVMAYIAKNLLAVEAKKPEPTEELIPMAIGDVAPGTMITEAHLGRGPYPKSRLEPDMLRTNRVIVGRYSRGAIQAGQPIRTKDLLAPNERPSLKVAEGMRAVTVEVGSHTAMLDGMIKPNDFVDVLFTYQANSNTNDNALQGGLTMRLFVGVRVVAVSRGPLVIRANNHVTLELTEPQANIITLARDRGAITLTLNPNGRGDGGLAIAHKDRVTLYEILGLKSADPVNPFMTELYRGSVRSTNEFNEKGRLIDSNAAQNPNAHPRQQLTPVPASPTPTPLKPTDLPSADQPTSPTAARPVFDQN